MGLHTPPLDYKGKHEYIKLHLFNELRWLLCASTEWFIQHHLKLDRVEGYHIQVYAMDSASLHARALFEFFVQPTTDYHYGLDAFLGGRAVLKSDSYSKNWKAPLHAFLMHAQDRSKPASLKSHGVDKHLNRMPVDFAREILKLWKEFEDKLGRTSNSRDQGLQKLAREKRKEAIESAARVVSTPVAQRHSMEIGQELKPIFVFAD